MSDRLKTARACILWCLGALVSWGLFFGLVVYTYATSGGNW